MRWRTTLVLLILTVGLGAYVSLVELKRPTPQEQAVQAKQVVRIPAETVTRLDATFPQLAATLERHGAWRLISPIQARADEALVERILNQLEPLTADRMLEAKRDKPLPLKEFGLDPPKGTLSVTGSSKPISLLFGEKTPAANRRYMKRADSSAVAVVAAGLFDTLDLPLSSYRSRDLLNVDAWQTTQISLMSPSISYTLEIPEVGVGLPRKWRLSAPVQDLADQTLAAETLSKLRGLRIEQFVTDQPQVEHLSDWGLDQPSAHILLRAQGQAAALELYVGKALPDAPEQLYAKRTDEASIYSVVKTSIDELLKDPQGMRAMSAFDFLPGQAVKVRLQHGSASWTIEQANGEWKPSEGDKAALDTGKVDELLGRLRELRILRFVDTPGTDLQRYGLDTPQGGIEVWLSGGAEPLRLTIGSPVAGSSRPYGQIATRPPIVELPESAGQLPSTTLDSLKRAAPTPSPAPAAPNTASPLSKITNHQAPITK
ncbi:MAG: DUF4340 domain-containing protein [Candidatus Omnitrophica bacterium]|nr:DUF4340 domain-containing protein [Candidatus Omnitrophota bacterium]